MPPIHFQVRLREVVRHAPDVASYAFDYVGRRPRFRPGQFVHLTLDDYDPSRHWPESRVFSIASAPAASEMRLTISRQGAYTTRILETLEAGRTLWCKGPYGDFEIGAPPPGETLVLVAGGTGITPFCAFMEQALLATPGAAVPGPAVRLYYGARAPELLIYRELAERWTAAVPGAGWQGYAESGAAPGVAPGRLEVDRIVAEQPAPLRCRYFLSGPRAMIMAFRDRLLQTHGVPPAQVLIDAWS